MPLVDTVQVNSPNVTYSDEYIDSDYVYQTTSVNPTEDGKVEVTPVTKNYKFRTARRVPKTGTMIVGLGGNNGTTVLAGVIANREGITWRTKDGVQEPNYYGSLAMASTIRLGESATGEEYFLPLHKILPMVHPNDLAIGGWDINNMDMAAAMARAEVLDWDLQRQLIPHMKDIVPLPSIYLPDWIASNQGERANNVIEETTKSAMVERLRQDMRKFKEDNGLESLVILWSANTERFADIVPGVNDTAENLMKAIENNEDEISPSTLFAVASILEGHPYINGSPQNTFVPGVIELAEKHNVLIGGDDFKSGQTKVKSVLVDFLVNAGIKPVSIVSYNHLGNNDGLNLSSARQFRSKEISKSNVVDDMVHSNGILYDGAEHPDHTIVIKYVPFVGDSKRAMDEYISKIFLNGTNTVAMHNTCEDSLLAAPLILDLVILGELMTRITYKTEGCPVKDGEVQYAHFHPVMSLLSYLLKAPLTPPGTPVVNALFKQRAAIENVLRACVGLPADNHMGLEHRTVEIYNRRRK